MEQQYAELKKAVSSILSLNRNLSSYEEELLTELESALFECERLLLQA